MKIDDLLFNVMGTTIRVLNTTSEGRNFKEVASITKNRAVKTNQFVQLNHIVTIVNFAATAPITIDGVVFFEIPLLTNMSDGDLENI